MSSDDKTKDSTSELLESSESVKRQSSEEHDKEQNSGDVEESAESSKSPEAKAVAEPASTDSGSEPKENDDAAARARARLERFKALKARAVSILNSPPSATSSLQDFFSRLPRWSLDVRRS